MLTTALTIASVMLGCAILLNLWRLVRGPTVENRILAMDTLSGNAIVLLILAGIASDASVYFEAALMIALLGFISTVALCKYLLRGDIIE